MRPYAICFVCTGNICRSPMAATVFSGYAAGAGLADRVRVESAGLGEWHVGQPAEPGTLRTLRRHGHDGRRHRGRLFEPGWFDRLDLVVGMDRGHARVLRSLGGRDESSKVRLMREFDPAADDDLDVPDPYLGSDRGFERCYELIDAACPGLLAAVRAELNA